MNLSTESRQPEMSMTSTTLKNLIVKIVGQKLGLRLGIYKPEFISDNNKVVYSYIFGVDDELDEEDVEEEREREFLEPVKR